MQTSEHWAGFCCFACPQRWKSSWNINTITKINTIIRISINIIVKGKFCWQLGVKNKRALSKYKYEIQTSPISRVTGGPMKSALDLGYGLKFYHATCGPSASSLISSASSSWIDWILSLRSEKGNLHFHYNVVASIACHPDKGGLY